MLAILDALLAIVYGLLAISSGVAERCDDTWSDMPEDVSVIAYAEWTGDDHEYVIYCYVRDDLAEVQYAR